MAAGFTVRTDGLEAVIAKLQGLRKDIEAKVTKDLDEFGLNVKQDAIRNLMRPHPNGAFDEGHLSNSITHEVKPVDKGIKLNIIAASDYAAFVEFGTKKFAARYVASLPQDWQSYAATFKGKGGGTANDLLLRITEWVKRKGFAALRTKGGNKSESKSSIEMQENVAYIIALRILQNGTRAHPFLFPAFEKNRVELINNLKKINNAGSKVT